MIMNDSKSNILEKLSKDDYKKCRKLMVGSVLATDMAKHMGDLGKFKTRIGAADFDLSGNANDKESTLNMLFHLADISNSTKPWEICHNWIELLFVEFFH